MGTALKPMSGEIVRHDAGTLIQSAITAGAGIEVVEKLAEMFNRERDDQRRQEYNAAMVDCQQGMKAVAADATNPQTRSKYAKYEQLDKAIRPAYTAAGFGLTFGTDRIENSVDEIRVYCIVTHNSGYERRHYIDMPCDGKGAKGNDVMTKTHARASAVSYGCRYLLRMIFNIAVGDGDDDGNGGAVQTITAEQAATIREHVARPGVGDVTLKAMLTACGCSSVETIPAAKYAFCIAGLIKREKAAGGVA